MSATESWQVVGDPSPPKMGSVYVKSHASYWADHTQIVCEYDAAEDAETGVEQYTVALVGDFGVCGELRADRYGGAELDADEVACEADVAAFSIPQHARGGTTP